MAPRNMNFQMIWGLALTLAGIGVFFRVSGAMEQMETIANFRTLSPYIRFCFYLLGTVLLGGGLKKIYHAIRHLGKDDSG